MGKKGKKKEKREEAEKEASAYEGKDPSEYLFEHIALGIKIYSTVKL